MAPITRRHFVRQTGFAAALHGYPVRAIAQARALLDADHQNGVPLDEATIRQLGSKIAGYVITPDRPEYDAARSIFNRAFDIHPAVIVRCAGPSDVARSLDLPRLRICHWRCTAEAIAGSGTDCATAA